MKKLKEILKMYKNKFNKGITLVSLVVTIIVLIILAGISISMLIGGNGILSRANEAKKKTEIANEEELIKLSIMDALTKDIEIITEESLKAALHNQFGSNVSFSVTQIVDGSFMVKFEESNRNYYIDQDGTVINNDKILEISTREDLLKFRDQVDGLNGYKADTFEGWYIYLKDTITLDINSEWIPIGRYITDNVNDNENSFFKGIFDGRNYEINGIKISSTTEKANGLFGLANNARIKNVRIGINCSISALQNTGGIVGFANNGTIIENCYNYSEIMASGLNLGGIVGALKNSSVINCFNFNLITNTAGTTGGRQGGIVGSAYNNSLIKNCCNIGNVTGVTFLGGIVGRSETETTIEGCCNSASISGSGNSIGGIGGTCISTKTINCYNTGDISSNNGYNIAGIVGAANTGNIKNCYNVGNINGNGNIGNIYGFNGDTTSENNYSKNDSFSYIDLGGAFKSDYQGEAAINNGYPILGWQ